MPTFLVLITWPTRECSANLRSKNTKPEVKLRFYAFSSDTVFCVEHRRVFENRRFAPYHKVSIKFLSSKIPCEGRSRSHKSLNLHIFCLQEILRCIYRSKIAQTRRLLQDRIVHFPQLTLCTRIMSRRCGLLGLALVHYDDSNAQAFSGVRIY